MEKPNYPPKNINTEDECNIGEIILVNYIYALKNVIALGLIQGEENQTELKKLSDALNWTWDLHGKMEKLLFSKKDLVEKNPFYFVIDQTRDLKRTMIRGDEYMEIRRVILD